MAQSEGREAARRVVLGLQGAGGAAALTEGERVPGGRECAVGGAEGEHGERVGVLIRRDDEAAAGGELEVARRLPPGRVHADHREGALAVGGSLDSERCDRVVAAIRDEHVAAERVYRDAPARVAHGRRRRGQRRDHLEKGEHGRGAAGAAGGRGERVGIEHRRRDLRVEAEHLRHLDAMSAGLRARAARRRTETVDEISLTT